MTKISLLRPVILAAALFLFAPPVGMLVNSITSVAVSFSPSEACAYTEGARLNRLLGVDTRRVRWCGLWVAHRIKGEPKHPASVDSWRKWRKPVKCAPGKIAIMRHRHVGIVRGVRNGEMLVESGNDGNAVRTRWRRASTIKHCRG